MKVARSESMRGFTRKGSLECSCEFYRDVNGPGKFMRRSMCDYCSEKLYSKNKYQSYQSQSRSDSDSSGSMDK